MFLQIIPRTRSRENVTIKMRILPGLLPTLLAIAAESKYIVPGGRWYDTHGTLISAHGGGITFDQKSSLFWWFGEYKTETRPEGGGVSVYSSTDLKTWTSGGLALGILLFSI
jgi:hypothetical protein